MNKFKKICTLYHVIPQSASVNSDLLAEHDEVDGVINYDEFNKIYMFGEENSGTKSNGPPQNYKELVKYHFQNGTLFSDPTFRPEEIALPKVEGRVIWKRPSEIVQNPLFIEEGTTRFDINQGKLGDCWFLASAANLTTNQKLFSMVVPQDQSFQSNYTGVFHFRFWQYGRWVDVVVDDKLPTVNNQLVFLHASSPREFWPGLLEKAYAKLYGSYKHIDGGQISEGLEDLCGGLSETYEANLPYLFGIMKFSYERLSFMGAYILSKEIEGRRSDGLITSHAYSVTDIKEISSGKTSLHLIRLRNPWGNQDEWNGNWSDNSKSWNTLSPNLVSQLLSPKPDGEFWMEFSDFQRCFTYVDIVHLNPSSFAYGKNKNWIVTMFEGCWDPDSFSAGGGYEYQESFVNNPQYHLTIRGSTFNSTYAVIIGLMQENRRARGEQQVPLQLNIFRVQTKAGQLLERSFLKKERPIIPPQVSSSRQLTVRISLPVGRYCIVPSTVQPGLSGRFLLRIYSEVNANAVYLNKV